MWTHKFEKVVTLTAALVLFILAGVRSASAQTPAVSLSPTALTFASQAVGTTSAAQLVTVANTGNATLTFSKMTLSGNFAFAGVGTCGVSISQPAGTSCTISINFTPTAAGTRTGTLTITDNASGGKQTVAISGTGASSTTGSSSPPPTTAPVLSLSSKTLTFASQTVGSTSAAQLVTVANTGNATLTFSNITLSGAFAFAGTGTCGVSISQPAGTSCTISINFKPTAAGTNTGVLTIADNASGSPQTVALSGTGSSSSSSTTPLQIMTTTLPAGTMGTTYSAALQAAGGTAPYSWKLASGSLPAGLSLSSSGTISGTPTTSCQMAFTVSTQDSEATPQTATAALAITVSGGSTSTPAPTISVFTASPATVASGSTATLSWTTSGASSITINPGAYTSTLDTGSTTVNPTATSTYTLTATNASGSATATTTVTVSASSSSGGNIDTAYANYISKYQSYASQYYVSPSGSGSTCSSASPCSLSTGLGKAGSGVVIWLESGTYSYSSTTSCSGGKGAICTSTSGTSSSHAAYVSQSYGGAVISISSSSFNGWPAWYQSGSYVDVVGMGVTDATTDGNSCTGIWNQGNNNIYAYNQIHDIPANTANCGNGAGGGGILNGSGSSGVSNTTFYGNVIWNIGASGNSWTHGIYMDTTGGDVAYNNIVYNASGFGIQCYHNCSNAIIENNDLINNSCGGLTVGAGSDGESRATGNYFANNIFYGNGNGSNSSGCTFTAYSECDGTSCSGASGNTITNNDFYNNHSTSSIPSGGSDSLANSLTSNPDLTDVASPASGGNFNLQAGSPAIGAGTETHAPATDIDDTTRANPPSIGAYE